jgi:hypothetical protein
MPTQLTGIHISFAEQAVEFGDRHGTVGRLRFTGQTVLYEGRPLLLLPSAELAPQPEPQQLDPSAAPDFPPHTFHNPSPRPPRMEL